MAVIGIDLGTTNSAAAVLSGDQPVIIANGEGERITPSIVAIGREGERLIGTGAKRQAVANPENTVYSVKRFIGRSFNSPEIKRSRDRFPFKIKDAPNGDVRISLAGKDYSPEELSSMILQKLKAEAEQYLEEPVDQAVITVPAYFDDRQRNATKDAGRIAGLDVLRIINEPTAAALAYGVQHRADRVVAVFDLGGGTFDISILEQADGAFQVLATSGDAFLGGDDFDEILIDWLASAFEKQNGIPLPRDPVVLQRLKTAAEAAKKDLSFAESTKVIVPFLANGPSGAVHLDVELLRAEFENLVSGLVDRSLEPCRSALEDAKLEPQDVDAVLLVGGQTRSPIVQRAVKEFFGKSPLMGINPDEAVALGAAVTAGVRVGAVEGVSLKEVTPLSLGVETFGGVVSRLIPRNTPIPTEAQKVYTTTEDDQLLISVHVVQGERELASDNRTLGLFELVGIRPAPKGEPTIPITFAVDEEGIVHVSARDEDTGREQSIRISGGGGLKESEISTMLEEAEAHRRDDEATLRRVELKNEGMNLVYAVRRILDDPTAELVPEFRSQVMEQVYDLEQSLNSADPAAPVSERMDALRDLMREIEYV